MKVILLKDIKGHGKAGEIIDCNDNFARNCIINKGLGLEANAKNLNDIKLKNKNNLKIDAENTEKALKNKSFLEDTELIVQVKVGKDNKMFGSVTAKEIADLINKEFNIVVDKRCISGGVLNQLGNTYVTIKLYKDISAKLAIKIEG